jgi:hypothetical protein
MGTTEVWKAENYNDGKIVNRAGDTQRKKKHMMCITTCN